MKKLLATFALLLPTIASASLTYTYDQPQLDGKTFTVSGEYNGEVNNGYVTTLRFGANEFDFGFGMDPLYYSWDINLDPSTTSSELAGEDFFLMAIGNGFYGMEASYTGPRKRNVRSVFNDEVISQFYMYDPTTGEDYLSQLNDGFTLALYLFTRSPYGGFDYHVGEELTLGFGTGNSWTLTNRATLIPEPYTAALFGIPLAIIGFRRLKRK